MNEVLGTTAGNALEVREAVDYLTGARREPRLHEVTVALAAARCVDRERRSSAALDSGAAAERFAHMVNALGGPADFVENPQLPTASVQLPVIPERPGYVTTVDTRAVGLVVTGLGGNRRREDDAIDYGVGPVADRPDRRRGRPGLPDRDRPRPRRHERPRGRDARCSKARPLSGAGASPPRRTPRPARPRMSSSRSPSSTSTSRARPRRR